MRDLMGMAPEGLSRGAGLALLALRLGLAVFFAVAAARNLAGDERMAADFGRWGYADWFRVTVALAQALGAALLLVPATASCGAAVLVVVLVGAVGTHLAHDGPASLLAPLPFLVAALVVLVAYRPPILR